MSESAATRPRIRLWLSLLLGLALSTLLVVLLLRRIDLSRVAGEMRSASWAPLALSLAVKLLGFCGLAWRAEALLRPTAKVPFPVLYQAQLLGFAANNVVPFRVGELAKVDFLARSSGSSRATVLAVAASERLLDGLCMLLLFAVVSPLVLPQVEHPGVVAASAGVIVLAGAAAWMAAGRGGLLSRLAGRLGETWGAPRGGRLVSLMEGFERGLTGWRSPGLLLGAFAGSLLYWGCSAIGVRLWLAAFDVSTPWFAPAVVLVFLAFGTALPASPGFIGTYDYFFVSALAVFGVEANRAASVALVGHALAIVPFTLVGLALVPGSARGLAATLRSLAGASPQREDRQLGEQGGERRGPDQNLGADGARARRQDGGGGNQE